MADESPNLEQIDALRQQVRQAELLLLDRQKLSRRLDRLRRHAKRNRNVARDWAHVLVDLDKSRQRAHHLRTAPVTLDYPEALPVSRERETLVNTIRDNQVIIVCGDTGSGKTTQLPKMAVEAGGGSRGRIGVTQPRRVSAVSMARRVAEECGSALGASVGMQVRFDEKTSAQTRIKFMTDGILLAELAHDRDWWQYDTLIIDEAHERSLNIDFILGHLHGLLERRKDLTVIISSATLDAERFSKFFNDAPVVSVEGRSFPIEDLYEPPHRDDIDAAEQVLLALENLDRSHGELDTLVFLPGEREIRDAEKLLSGRYRQRAAVLPLYARLSLDEQQRVFREGGQRRIILATNVAETSITLPGIRAVIDTGLVRVHRYLPQAQVQLLQTELVSQASARQRRGRCGRTGPGVCVHLYSEETLAEAPGYTDPEIQRVSLAEVLLRMAVLGLPTLDEFPLLNPPKAGRIAEGYRSLWEVGAMTRERELTDPGRKLASFPLEPRLARMLWEGQHEQVLAPMLVLSAFLSIQDPRERPREAQQAADDAQKKWEHAESDFLTILQMWNDWMSERGEKRSRTRLRKFCRAGFLNMRRMEEWDNLVQDLRDTAAEHKFALPKRVRAVDIEDSDGIHRSVLAGLPLRIGTKTDSNRYEGVKGQVFHIFPGSSVFEKSPKWVMAYTLMETTKLYARTCAVMKPEWVEEVAPHVCKVQVSNPAWNRNRGFVEALEKVSVGALPLVVDRRIHYGRVNPEHAREIFVRDAWVPNALPVSHPSLKKYAQFLKSLRILEEKLRRPGLLTEPEELVARFNAILPADVYTATDFKKWIGGAGRWVPNLDEYLKESGLELSDFPDDLSLNDCRIRLRYQYQPDSDTDGIILRIRDEDVDVLPQELMEWTIPAWLPEKVRLLLRSLPKPIRVACNPMPQTVDAAVKWTRENDLMYSSSLLEALAAFLRVKLDRTIGPGDFSSERIPAWLRFHLEVFDIDGKVCFRGDEWPNATTYQRDTTVLSANHRAQWHVEGAVEWPGGDLPVEVDVRGRKAYPALEDEGTTVGVRVYPAQEQADNAHRKGLLRLFRLVHGDVVRSLEKRLPLPMGVQMELAVLAKDGQAAIEDVIENILWDTLSLHKGPIRGPVAFNDASELARQEVFGVASEHGEALEKIFALRSDIMELWGNTQLPAPIQDDVADQWALLWAPGFLKESWVLKRYPRYLAAMEIRIKRLSHGLAKDEKKRAQFQHTREAVRNKWPQLNESQRRKAMQLLEEWRIATFAPECKPHEKISDKRILQWLET